MHNIGDQVMQVRGLRMDGTWAITEPKPCLCCRAPSVFYDKDTARCSVMTCDDCGAMEVVTKHAGTWWYHGAKQPDEWPATFLEGLNA